MVQLMGHGRLVGQTNIL